MKTVLLAASLLTATTSFAAFPTLQLKPVAVGQFNSPTTVTHAGDGSGRLFITDQRGKIHILEDGAVLPAPFLDLSAKLVTEQAGFDERGLLGLAFHPGYSGEGPGAGRFYVFYSAPSPDSPGPANNPVNCRSVIAEYRVSASNPNLADPLTERVLLSFNKPQFNHNGGELAFGPDDGFLYISTGDGGSSNDDDVGHTGGSSSRPPGALGNAQDVTRLLGKLLRIDPLGTDGPGGQYGIPASNPFVLADIPAVDERKEIYAYGLRNPWRFSFDSGGAHRMFLPDVGQGKFEEVNLLVAGGNYGWSRFEGPFDFDVTTPSTGPYVTPIAAYAHPGQAGSTGLLPIGLSITGGHVYRGSEMPSLDGKYIFGDWSTSFGSPAGTLLGLEETTPGNFTLSKLDIVGGNPIGRYIPAFGIDEAGEVYVATRTMLAPSATLSDGTPSGQLFKLVEAEVENLQLPADRDNSIYSERTENSNGQGDLFAGLIANFSGMRRALIRFDLSGLPPGSSVATAAVTIEVNKVGTPTGGNFDFTLHRLTRDWGEGNSSGTGTGAPAAAGEATWLQSAFGSQSWTTAGGDFVAAASATASVGAPDFYTWSSPGLVTDVQGWLSQPATRFGWILRGNEVTPSAKVFTSRHSANGPVLTVSYYTPPALTRREAWERQFFKPGQFIDPDGDADADRIAALLEYGWDLDPTLRQDLSAFLQITLSPSSAAVAFRRDPRAVDLEYRLETSPDLAVWTPVVTSTAGALPTGPAYVSEGADPLNAATRRVVASIPLTPASQKALFVRLSMRRL
ncbi:PQQ-dependent sugar dehydrogenase [Luteolibacter sp. GHJ8]|uniref:PQQ-dependent sugar dehydrogenase n=1 Tax=Luteolibacter rhizosphaerae TaxID=2989719 RepID=A0ABT3GA78_9BACT|nr:PQQ-dependent sugar dehydrogenase [Luteolibacter rhizosphaerae]MCW1916753.1 PQQ-dependent sugar dehydrogenase [Luteolibacter rhizosphaerae]